MTLGEIRESSASFNDPADQEEVGILVKEIERLMGKSPSIATLEAMLDFFRAREVDMYIKAIDGLCKIAFGK